jgi:hypothetical protein
MKTIDVCNNQAGDITIHIPGSYLQHLVSIHPYLAEGTHVTHTKTFSDAIVRELNTEGAQGFTIPHLLMSAVIDDVIDQGAEGVKLGDKV